MEFDIFISQIEQIYATGSSFESYIGVLPKVKRSSLCVILVNEASFAPLMIRLTAAAHNWSHLLESKSSQNRAKPLLHQTKHATDTFIAIIGPYRPLPNSLKVSFIENFLFNTVLTLYKGVYIT